VTPVPSEGVKVQSYITVPNLPGTCLTIGDLSAHEKAASSLGSSGASGSRPKSIPLRLYLRQAGEAESPVGKWDEVAFTTRCADAIDAENGEIPRGSVASRGLREVELIGNVACAIVVVDAVRGG
jgi:hypothetical protein